MRREFKSFTGGAGGNRPISSGSVAETRKLHLKDDVDSGDLAHHHTLGWEQGRAASGFETNRRLAALEGEYGEYTPVLTATTTNPIIGAGFNGGRIEGAYIKYGRRVEGWARFRFETGGAIMNPGSGTYELSLPFEVDDSLMISITGDTGLNPVIGTAVIRDNSAVGNSISGGVYPVPGGMSVRVVCSTGGNMSHLTPWAWAAGDACGINFSYPTVE